MHPAKPILFDMRTNDRKDTVRAESSSPPADDRIRGGRSRISTLTLLLLLPFAPLTAAASPTPPALGGAPWWILLLCVAVGAGAVALWHWLRLRRVRQKVEARIDALRTAKQETEEALDAATDRAEKLKDLSEAKSQFLEEVSHAFRRPLTLTLGPIDTLLEGQYGTLREDVQTQLHLAQRNGTRVLWLVNQLLDLAELETDSMTLAPTQGNLSTFLVQGLRSFEDLAERRNVNLGFESALDDPEVRFDESKMETILANLLSSAFRSIEDGGSIRTVLRPAPANEEGGDGATTADDIELLIEHTGAEMAAHPDGNPFDWSRKKELLREPGSVSASVGLYLVHELADLHGGYLETNTLTGGKTQVAVRLPRQPKTNEDTGRSETDAQTRGDTIPRFLDVNEARGALELSRRALSITSGEEASRSPTGPTLSPNPTEQTSLPGETVLPGPSADSGAGADPHEDDASTEDRTTVLVIDDNSVICTLVRSHLEPEYRVEEAHDGAEGYNLARRLLPDLVITDVMMPEVDGFDLCRKIKEDPDIDHVPVVFLTARADLDDKVEGFDTGADAYLTKPFEPEALIARVENLIATRQTLRESFQTEDTSRAEPGLTADGLENAESALPPTAKANSLKEKIEDAIAEHLTDPEFGVSELAEATALSASQLRRRMKEIYDRTPVQLIRRRRLEAGARLLQEREDATIGEVAYAVGFNSQSYFSRSFRDEFGTSPSQYRARGVAA